MRVYLAKAWCDWGSIFENERIVASSFEVAFRRAGILARERARRRPKEITINVKNIAEDHPIYSVSHTTPVDLKGLTPGKIVRLPKTAKLQWNSSSIKKKG